MLKQLLSFALVALFVFNIGSAPISAQNRTANNAASIEKFKSIVVKRSADEKKRRVTIKMLDGTKFKGYVSQPTDDSFVLTDSKTGQTTSIFYRDVSEVRGGLSSTENKILIGLGIGAVVAVSAVVFGYLLPYCRNEGRC